MNTPCRECGRLHLDQPRANPRGGKVQQFGLCDPCFERWACWAMRQFEYSEADVEAMSGEETGTKTNGAI